MASTASHGDQRQKKGVMYVYKLGTGESLPKPKTKPKSKPEVNYPSLKKAVLRGSWGLMRRSKTTTTVREVVVNNDDDDPGRRVVEGSGTSTTITTTPAVISVKEIVEARKSASSEPRKSVSHLEIVNVTSVAAFLQVKILVTDMPGFMQVHAFRCARRTYDCLDNFSSKHMAYNIKKEFDKVYGPAWHCIVGSSFGSFVTHSTGGFLYFSMEKLYILVFKTKVQRALHS